VLTGSSGQPLRPAMLWSDARSQAQLEVYRALDAATLERLGNPIVAGMMGASLLWLKTHAPELLTSSRWALLPKDWLRFSLTGEVYSDPSDASGTLLYDVQSDDWARDLLGTLGLPDLLPPLKSSSEIAGYVTPSAAALLGVQAGTPVATGGGDTPCAMLGNGILKTGVAQLSVGTGAQIVAPRDAPTSDSRFRTHLYRSVTGNWYAMAAMQNAGLALERVRGWLGLDWDRFYAAAFSQPDSSGLIFKPYLSGERTPHMNASLRGSFQNLGLHHTRAHLARAGLEGVAFSIGDGLEALRAAGVEVSALRLAGGGTVQTPWRQLLSDALGVPLLTGDAPDASARGAAMLAGLSIGVYSDPLETAELLPAPEVVAAPAPSAALQGALAAFRAAGN
jgi:xylulokinase